MSADAPLPNPAKLGLTSPRAAEDLATLGITDAKVLAALADAGDPDLALNTLYRLFSALDDAPSWQDVQSHLAADGQFRIRLFALLGGSTALSDHLVAHPQRWGSLLEPLPGSEELFRTMLAAVDAAPAGLEGDTASEDLTTPGTYRAGQEWSRHASATAPLREHYLTLMMRIAASDLAGEVGYREVTEYVTTLADAALTAALAVAIRETYGDDDPDSRLAIMAMGKCGARELNYISDVDVIFVAEPATAPATKTASTVMQLGTACFFEVDANLRPEGKSGALVRTVDSHLAYYKRWAQTWEFQALLKARPMTGNAELGQRYIAALRPLVWEASQRTSFVEDVQAMRRRVLEHVPKDLRERELKLGSGGLRDVEFAVQLLQLVHGRIDPSIRVKNTVDALQVLTDGGYIGREDGAKLIDAYEFLRLLEHRLQLTRFKRTHQLPKPDDAKAMRWLARTSGFRTGPRATATEALRTRLKQVRFTVANLHERIFYRPLLSAVVNLSYGEATLSADAVKAQLAALGYRHPARAHDHLTALVKGTSRRAKLQAILLPSLMHWLGGTADPDAGLLNYRKLSEAAEDKSWFLRMLRDEGVVSQRLMQILGTSPYASELIIAAPEVVKLFGDGSSGPRLLEAAPDQVEKAIVAAAGRYEDPDRAVSVARSLRRAELARIAAADLLGFMEVRQVCEELTYVWDAVLRAALAAEMRAQHQDPERPAPARIAVIGMGRLGGAELGYGSDADVMVVAAANEGYNDHEATVWAAKVIEAMRARLAKPSADPPLEVDLGLRPEGRSGAVVRTVESYERYYTEWGEVWERQALLRAVTIAGDRDLGADFLRVIDPVRYPPGGASQRDIREVRRIKAHVDTERLPPGADRATHTKLGRGALADVEWTVQLLTMMHAHTHPALHTTSTLEALDYLADPNDDRPQVIEPQQARQLREAWLMATRARNAIVLVTGKRTDQLPAPGTQLGPVAGSAGYSPEHQQQFLEDYRRTTRRAYRVVEEVFWGEAPSHEFE